MCVLSILLLPVLRAQEGRVTLSASFGIGVLSLKEIDEDGRKDIEAYNRLGVPVGGYEPLTYGLGYEGRVDYRTDREISIALFGRYMRTETDASFRDSSQSLFLERAISSTDFGVDVTYSLPPLMYAAEAALFVGIGRMTGYAEQSTRQHHEQKSADTTVSVIDQDAFAEYRKSKLYVRGGVRLAVPLVGPVWFNASALYKYAPLGTLDGTLREVTLVRPHTTTVEFDFSSIDINVGLSYVIGSL
jgi:hypothetical protein